jgi:hypothetical protein
MGYQLEQVPALAGRQEGVQQVNPQPKAADVLYVELLTVNTTEGAAYSAARIRRD